MDIPESDEVIGFIFHIARELTFSGRFGIIRERARAIRLSLLNRNL